ncbi:MAG: threonine--tRNA ligase [Actinomycetes bacterium]
MKVILPDGNELALADGATGAEAAAAIGPGLAKAALAVTLDGQIQDLAAPLSDGAAFGVVTGKSDEALDLIRHDAAHVLASAVIDLYPGTKVSIGPAIENGFYYDFDFPEGITISEDDLPAIEDRMREHIKAAESFERSDIPVAEALERFKALGEDYKVELIEDLITNESVESVSLYRNGEFTDLCRGPHTPATDRIKAIALQSVAGAYWRGDSTRKMLTRIYGTAFLSQKELDAHLELLEEARARDHRRLGTQLNLFRFSEVSPGSAFWLPRGTQLFNSLVELSREMGAPRGYQEVKTPQLYDAELWRTSGHWDKYRENMFLTESEDRPMGLKPMNCPGHAHLYGSQQWSYRDLPVRYSEPGLLHRNEPSGTLHGLLRVRHFCQDDAHIFCTEDQIQSEVASCLEFAFATYRLFGLEPSLELSTRPDQRIGDDATWDRAESALREALDQEGHPYTVNEGDGAFYGPKIDLHITDSLGRSWQLGTVQLDYSMPERFDLAYTGADNAEHRPVMIHRALMGSYERFIGILIEHYAGVFPFWLAPIQIAVLPVADRHLDYAKEVAACLAESGLRADIDERTESVGRKIRDAEISKAPVMLIVGDREAEGRSVSVRERADGDLGDEMLDALVARLSAKAANRDA